MPSPTMFAYPPRVTCTHKATARSRAADRRTEGKDDLSAVGEIAKYRGGVAAAGWSGGLGALGRQARGSVRSEEGPVDGGRG